MTEHPRMEYLKMTTLEEAELQHQLAKDAIVAQIATIKTVESRLAQIDGDLQRFDVDLGEAAFTNNLNIDWARQAADRLGLDLEKSTLPDVIVRLKEPLPALQAAAQRATREIDRLSKSTRTMPKSKKSEKCWPMEKPTGLSRRLLVVWLITIFIGYWHWLNDRQRQTFNRISAGYGGG